MERLICLAVGYVCGLFQTGYLVGKMNHIDIRKEGSGNSGTTNALRVLGWKAGIFTFLGDVLKCVAAYFIVRFMYRGSDCLPFINSVWHMPQSLFLILVTALFFFIPVIVTRYISVGSLCAYTAFLIEMILFGQWGWFDMEAGYCYELYGIAVLLTALAWYRHRENIKRLVKGTENKFGSKRKGH